MACSAATTNGSTTGRVARALLATLILAASACTQNVPPQTSPTRPSTFTPPPRPVATDAGPVKVALLLPLSGKHQELGTAMLDAAQMALFEIADNRLTLLPRDDAGTPQGAAAAAQEAIRMGAQLILGPLLGANVGAVQSVARPVGVPVLTFSTDWRLAAPEVFVLGFTPAEQVDRVVQFAGARGLSRLAILAPRDVYGDQVVAALTAAARSGNLQVVREERYQGSDAELKAAANRLSAAWSGGAVGAGATTGSGAAFDVLMIAEGARLRPAVEALPDGMAGPTRIRLIGTGLWDLPDLGRQVPQLAGAWYAAPEPRARMDFEARFAATYGRQPPRLASLAYDATALAAVVARATPPGQPVDRALLTNPDGYSGVDGIFRLLPNGTVQRGLAVLEISAGGPRVIDPAPLAFPAPYGS